MANFHEGCQPSIGSESTVSLSQYLGCRFHEGCDSAQYIWYRINEIKKGWSRWNLLGQPSEGYIDSPRVNVIYDDDNAG